MLPSTKLRLGAPSQRRAPPPSPDKENPPPRKRPAPVDLSAFAFDRNRRPRAAEASPPPRRPFQQFERGMPPASPVARRPTTFAQFRYSLSGNEDSQSPGK